MNGDRIEFSANDVAKLSFGRTSYGGIDELGHTHVCPGSDPGPRSLVVARAQGLQTEDAQGRLRSAAAWSSAFDQYYRHHDVPKVVGRCGAIDKST